MNFIQKAGVLVRDPHKLIHYCWYSYSRVTLGYGVARIPWGGHMRTSSFSEYLSVYGLMPDAGELGMIQKHLANAKEVFDLGANVGVWTVLMGKANPKARVHSFEPSPDTFNLLKKNVEQNNCPNVVLNMAAVSDRSGKLNFEVPKNVSIFGRVAPSRHGEDDEGRFLNADLFTVPAIQLIEYCAANSINEIDFIKIDVEGHEFAALKGLEPFLQEHKVKAIYIETIKENHDRMGTNFSDLLKFLRDCGYKFYVISRDASIGSPIPIEGIMAHNHLCLPG